MIVVDRARTDAGFRSALAHPAFARLLGAHAAATVAQLVATLALGLAVLDHTSSGLWVSVTVALGFAPYALFSGYAGALAGHFSGSAVLAWSAGVRAACATLGTALLLTGPPVPVLVALAAVLAVSATPAYPAVASATPRCVPDGHLAAANALVTAVENVAWIAGPGLLGLLVLGGLGPSPALGVTAGLFGIATVSAWSARLPGPVRHTSRRWWRQVFSGFGVLRDSPATRGPMAMAIVENFLYGYVVVAVVLLAHEEGRAEQVGWLNAALATGALASMLVVNRIAAHGRPAATLRLVLVATAAAVALLGAVGATPAGVALVAVAGAGCVLVEVLAVTLLQRAAPENELAGLFGAYDQLNVGVLACGSLLAGPLSALWGARPVTVGVSAACLAAAYLVAAACRDPAIA